MPENREKNAEDLESEIRLAEEQLKEDIVKKELEAEEKIDEILSEKGMKFCSRCGRKVRSRLDWGGKCLYRECDCLICKDCWILENKRFCRDHITEVSRMRRSEKELEAAKKGKSISSEIEKIRGLAVNYITLIENRFNELGGPDWDPHEFFAKTRIKIENKGPENFSITVFKKGWVRKFKKIQIFVKQLNPDPEKTIGSLTSEILEKFKKSKTHNIIIFVSNRDSITPDTANFAESFDNKKFSLFLVDFDGKKTYFNGEDKIANHYASWIEPKGKPAKFEDILRGFSERIAGKSTVKTGSFSQEFGIPAEEGYKILKKCNFLSKVSGTDSFVFKKEK
jgi:hypothetical protein